LALSLVAETFAQRAAVTFRPESAPDIIRTLVEQFVQKAPGPAHRAALEACAMVRLLNESLLGAMLKQSEPGELFDWLRGLSFVESGSLGLYPHDLAREALVTDLRWRHPDWYAELHRRARDHYFEHLAAAKPEQQQRLLFDLIYLHRDNPAVRPYFEWAEGSLGTGQGTLGSGQGPLLPDALREGDAEALLAMVERHEGEASARLAAYWLDRRAATGGPATFLVFRDAQRQPAGFMALIALEQAVPADLDADPATAAASSYLQRRAALRPGERATLFRFWMDADAYQAVSPTQSLVFIQAVNHYLTTPGLAFTFFPCADPDFWALVFAFGGLNRLVEADFEVGGRCYGVYGNDWRAMPPAEWLNMVGAREVGSPPAGSPAAGAPSFVDASAKVAGSAAGGRVSAEAGSGAGIS
jgi:hypothetical protein